MPTGLGLSRVYHKGGRLFLKKCVGGVPPPPGELAVPGKGDQRGQGGAAEMTPGVRSSKWQSSRQRPGARRTWSKEDEKSRLQMPATNVLQYPSYFPRAPEV